MSTLHSKLFLSAMLLVLLVSCTELPPHQAPVTTHYSKIAPETPKDKDEVRYHLVKKGDSLYGLSLLYDLDYRQIAQWNRLALPYRIEIGQKLRLSDPNNLSNKSTQEERAETKKQDTKQHREQLPTTPRTEEVEQRREQLPTTPRTEEVEQRREQLPTTPRTEEVEQRREQLPRATQKEVVITKQKLEEAAAINGVNLQRNIPTPLTSKSNLSNNASPKFYELKNSAEKHRISQQKKSIISIDNVNILMLHFQWPIKGKILKVFSQANNKGIDIAGEMGLDVSAAEAGKVVYSGQGLMGYGKVLIIKHNDLYLSAYANNSQLLVAEGSTVKKGEVIAKVGQAGSNKTSLHFEIRKNGIPVNPVNFLPERQ